MTRTDPFTLFEPALLKAQPLGLIQAHAEDERLDGRTVTVDGRRLVNFGSCGYLGLETHPALTGAVIDAVRRYGTQFSSTRAYLSAPDYRQAERLLSEMLGRPTAIAANTSMANMSVITTLIKDGDVMLVDAQAHRSVQAAATIVRAQGTPTEVIPHGNLEVLERKVIEHAGRRVWFLGDGLYSMFGDIAPLRELAALVERHDHLWMVIDDAHSVSWTGRHGRGHALERMSPAALARTVVTGSLNKSFGAAGGVMTFPTEALRHEVRTIGWPMMFSGPLQPPMLAAVVASTRLHLDDEIRDRQRRIVGKIELFNAEAARQGIPLVDAGITPIRYVAAGNTDSTIDLASRLQKVGYFTNTAIHPAVPLNRAGIRIALTLHQTDEDIVGLVEALAANLPLSLADNGFSSERLLRAFHRQFAGREITLREVGAW
ncbi:aminotransferase class I/II-fold pyridoxal phosphate-dependent enzyme [Kutzneria buriramensis]|uniref:8-amino-7-oxononanoate synthase n=1 Tax=Kutzneria buriramensis TaxID=1045776 RepID=A0A3E0HEE9_9PSEU|nr:aminotransferase class I/II-fold pyridoxal phosphate-dependent enzyme [Kutzneria buriramensis]REH43588.1 7-keto-8-aminopelargonate synthetase-like enzyme [Kutzneria buriramensis]